MITIINGERIRQTLLPSSSSFTFVVNFTLSSLIFFIIMNNQKIILVSCFKNLSFIQGSPIKCSNEGQTVKVPFLSKDPCITCKCTNGEIACQRDSCFGFKGGGIASLSGGSGCGRGTSCGSNRRLIGNNYVSNNANNNILNGVGVCKIENSPSKLYTFDGLAYKYIGQYNYVLSRDCSKKIFSIHLVNTDPNGGQVSPSLPSPGALSAPSLPSPSPLSSAPSSSYWPGNSIRDIHPLMNTINHDQLNYSLITNNLQTHHSSSQLQPNFNTLVVKIKGIKVRISKTDVKIGRKLVTLPYIKLGVLSVIRDGRKIIVRSNIGIRVIWDRQNSTQVFIPRSFKNKVCGLCGNFNGSPKDDFMSKRGLKASDSVSFFNSWKVGGHRSLKDVIVLKLYQYTKLRTKKKKSLNIFRS
ncbi:uncharacterized protein LOC107361898 [Tetranychus urticae]|uniref:VWFD domain-containing protein n=1 Tax=Tetranychus urticae TaxID=32264 RepID=T1K903_TETUR|nr:uncharacterized protein LOC107361898 [Tetranychus urticae]